MKRKNGFTLVELLIAIVVVTLLLAMSVPAMQEFFKNNRLSAQANDILLALQIARTEAVKRGSGSVVCASTDQATCSGDTDWSTGWIVFSDLDQEGDLEPGTGNCLATEDCVLRVNDALSGKNSVTANTSQIDYLPTGLAKNIPDDPDDATKKRAVFTLVSSDCYMNQARNISVNEQGHTHITTEPCP